MRPLTLRVAGLRSYRSERTLDFTDRSLLAILGDTGSGKSSLLEALYGALYGQSTWDARGLGALIADGIKTLQVELTFSARGRTYTVSRSTSRDSYPPAKHLLRCHDDGEVLDGLGNVNRRITQVVGLTDKEFLRVVILPQGRFAELLQGTAGDRTPVLRGILGLGVLSRVRDIADSQGTALSDALAPLTAARARLFPQPEQVAEQAGRDVDTHAARRNNLAAAADTVTALARACSAVEQALPAVNGALDVAGSVDLGPVLTVLQDVEQAGAQIAVESEKLVALQLTLSRTADEAEIALRSAAGQGVTAGSVALAGAVIDQLVEQVPDLRRDAHAARAAMTELDNAALKLAADEQAVAEQEQAATAARDALTGLDEAARTADHQARDAERALAELGQLTSRTAEIAAGIEPVVDGLFGSAGELRAARDAVVSAAAAERDIREQIEALRAANAAAHVAAGHAPGEPCPVCAQALPADFVAPAIVGEQELAGQLKEAAAALKASESAERARDKATAADADQILTEVISLAVGTADIAMHAAAALPAAVSTGGGAAGPIDVASLRTKAQAALDDALERVLTEQQHTPPPKSAKRATAAAPSALADQLRTLALAAAGPRQVDLPSPGSAAAATLLAPLTSAREQTAAALATARLDCADTDAAVSSAAATLTAARTQLHKDRAAQYAETTRVMKAADRLGSQLTALPPGLSGPLTSALAFDPADPALSLLRGPELTETVIEAVRTDLDTHAKQLADWTGTRDQARIDIGEVQSAVADLADQRRLRVDAPAAAAGAAMERARSAIREISVVLPSLQAAYDELRALSPSVPGQPPEPALEKNGAEAPADGAPAELAAACQQLAERLAVTTQLAATTTAAAGAALKASATQMQATVTAAGMGTVAELQTELADVSHQVREALSRQERALAQAPVAAGLDEGLRGLRGRLAVLRAVKDVMTTSQFPDFVIAQRQQALLRIASTLLAKLTRDGYGFGADFLIVDRRTGQARHAKTLSGGETFLASLALALALVEISNRSGGQLDALFLDEGFGSLDASILSDALDVLREQAVGGRLVGVISHLHAVAAEVEDVLVVSKTVEGSDFRWLDDDERDQYLLDEQAAGLLG